MKLSSSAKNWIVILAVGLLTGLFCWQFLENLGHTDEHVRILLRLTARIAFLIYLLVFIARPLRQLFVNDTTRWLLKERRSFGLAFASVHTVHLSLIFYRTQVAPDFSIVYPDAVPGTIAYALLLAMMITSFDGPARALGPRRWRILHKTGLYLFGVLFIATLLPWSAEQILAPERLWFTALTAAAIVIRLTAFLARRKRR